MEVNEGKRKKFMEYAGKRVNNVMHDIQILEPMARSGSYDFTKDDVEKMFFAMQDALDTAKAESNKKFEEKTRAERKVFSFDSEIAPSATETAEYEIVEEESFNV
jgi:xylose isomerase